MAQRSRSAPVRGRPPAGNININNIINNNTKIKKPTTRTPRQQQSPAIHNHISLPPKHYSSSASYTSARSARSGRNNILDDFNTKFVKTRNELHARNQQCESLAQEIEKYKKELIQAHTILSSLEQDEAILKEKINHSQQRHSHETGHHKTLTHELSQSRKEKQERLKERLFLSQELQNYQLMYKQLYEENIKAEEQAKNLSKKLQGVNKERLKFRQDCINNQAMIEDYNAQLDQLQAELKEMKDVVTHSIGDSLSSHPHSSYPPHSSHSSRSPSHHPHTPSQYQPHSFSSHTPPHASHLSHPHIPSHPSDHRTPTSKWQVT